MRYLILLMCIIVISSPIRGAKIDRAAQAHADIAISHDQTLLALTDKIIEATRPDYGPLYAGMAAGVAVVIACVLTNARRPVVVAPQAPAPQPTVVIFQTAQAVAWQSPDGTITLRRLVDGCERVYFPGDEFHTRLIGGKS